MCAEGLGGTPLSLSHSPGPRGTFFFRARQESLVLIYIGKLRLFFLQECLLLLVPESPREALAPIFLILGEERGNRVGKHLFLLNKATHFFRQMSWGGKDKAGDQQ